MEMYVDGAEWVMGPNVYSRGQMSEGGIFATKPYICGSNYMLKMSNYKPGEWCDVVDGLYWRFLSKHRLKLQTNPRMTMMYSVLDKMDSTRKAKLLRLAEIFIVTNLMK